MDISHSNTTSDTSRDTPITSTPTAAIAGGVVGALVVLGLVALFFFLLGRRRHRRDASLFEHEHEQKDNSNTEDIEGIASSTSPTVEESGLNPFASSTSVGLVPERRRKGHVEQAPPEAISPITSGGDTQSPLQASSALDEDGAMSSHTWFMGPPAYDQVVSR